MWMLSFIPDTVLHPFVNTIFYAGVVGTVLGFIFNFNFLAPYRPIVQIVGIMLLVAGVYFKGGYEVEQQWRVKVAELQAQVAAAEAKSKETNTVIQEKIITKVKHIKDTQVKIQQQIVEKEKIINGECVVPAEAVEILNRAAEKPVGVTK